MHTLWKLVFNKFRVMVLFMSILHSTKVLSWHIDSVGADLVVLSYNYGLLKVGSNPVWTIECVGGPHVVLCTTSSIGTIGFVILDSTPCLILFPLEPIIILTFNKVSSSPFELSNRILSKFYFFLVFLSIMKLMPCHFFYYQGHFLS